MKWVDYEADWAYWINPVTFRMPRVKKAVPEGVVVLTKEREVVDTGQSYIATEYGFAEENGVKQITKPEATDILTEQMLDYMRERDAYPVNTEIVREYANGNVEIEYKPSDYDRFIIKLTPELIGGDVLQFLEDLADASDLEGMPDPWRIEPAKSGRAKCRTCKQTIPKGELRIGEPSYFDGKLTYKWHHLKCGRDFLQGYSFEKLAGYVDLTNEQKRELEEFVPR
ncbi:MAG: hypothetical protein BAJATHORv1_70074 [Candidatus Thorarchaeota archaeon]|nr:MAG: hypothetical protein BAJATHORv1_70074 [Candidatus Thorarchaeota archaeon]